MLGMDKLLDQLASMGHYETLYNMGLCLEKRKQIIHSYPATGAEFLWKMDEHGSFSSAISQSDTAIFNCYMLNYQKVMGMMYGCLKLRYPSNSTGKIVKLTCQWNKKE